MVSQVGTIADCKDCNAEALFNEFTTDDTYKSTLTDIGLIVTENSIAPNPADKNT